jgi:hypothetical protein
VYALPEHPSSFPVFGGVHVTRSLVLCTCFVDRCLSFCPFVAIVLSVFLGFTVSDYPYGIFKLFLPSDAPLFSQSNFKSSLRRFCWHKSCSSNATLFLDWNRNYKTSTAVITSWWTVTKYLHWIFYFLRKHFLSSITDKTFTGLDCIYEQHGGSLIRSRNCLPFAGTWVHPWFLVESVLLIFLVFCVVFLLCLSSFCVLSTQGCQCLWIVHSWLPTCICCRYHYVYNC